MSKVGVGAYEFAWKNIVKKGVVLSYGGATRAFKLCDRNARKLRGIADQNDLSLCFTQKLEVVGQCMTCFSDILGPLVLKKKKQF